MHNAKVNTSDLSGIIIDQADGSCIKFSLNGKFFAYLPPNRLLKFLIAECRSKKRLFIKSKKRFFIIYVVDVSTNANRPFRYQTLLASFFAADIMTDIFAISDHHVWNYLFVGWISLCTRAWLKTVVFLLKNCWQITGDICAETLKNPKPLEKRTRKNQNIFVCNSHNQLKDYRSPNSESRI